MRLTFEESNKLISEKLGRRIANIYEDEFDSYVHNLKSSNELDEEDIAKFFIQFIEAYFLQPKILFEAANKNILAIINHHSLSDEKIITNFGELEEYRNIETNNLQNEIRNFKEILKHENQ